MTISLETISFNHDSGSATSALTIQQNETEVIAVPEWTQGMTRPEDSRAAYTIRQISANTLTIKAEFSRQGSDPASVEVRAVARPGNVLGDLQSRTINFGGSLTASEFFNIDSPSQNLAVRVNDIGWDWLVEETPLQTTEHRIYTLLDQPKEPWGPEFQLPWTDVLDHACLHAEGATNVNDAADMLTRWVFSLGESNKLRYDDYGAGSSTFTIGGMRTFLCTSFLQTLADDLAPTARVNCTDCATILSSFANILGCDLTQSRIGNDFDTNRIQKIGVGSTIKQSFRFHEVAWKFPNEGAASLYDCCLQVDGDVDPTDDDFLPTPGINTPLGAPGSGYHFRLVASDRVCYEQRGTRVRRKIDGRTTTPITLDPERRRRLEREYDFPDWQGTPASETTPGCRPRYKNKVVSSKVAPAPEQQLFVKNFSLSNGSQSLAGWAPGNVKSFESKPDPLRVTDVTSSSKGCSGATVRMITYECSSIAAARSFLLTLLGEFNLSGIRRRPVFVVHGKQVEIGDVAFAGPDDLVLLFARANNVIFIQNAGGAFVPVSPFAQAVDREITSGPDPNNEKPIDMKHFHIPEKQIHVGDEVRIHTNGDRIAKEDQVQFKFFAPAGEVFVKENDLLYRCKAAGEQTVTVLAHTPGGETARQELKLVAEPPAASQDYNCHKLDEEECVMPDIMGVWSSIRPTNNGGDTSADLTVDGYFEIRRCDPDTGKFTGFYWGPGIRNSPEEMKGSVIFESPTSYKIELSHPVGDQITRKYEGKLVAMDNNDDFGVQIVAGRYRDEVYDDVDERVNSDNGTVTRTSALMAGNGGQDNGTWVATKP